VDSNGDVGGTTEKDGVGEVARGMEGFPEESATFSYSRCSSDPVLAVNLDA